MMTPENAILAGHDAERLLSESFFKSAVAEIERQAIQAARECAGKANETEQMRIHLLEAQAIRNVEQYLRSIATTGKQVEAKRSQHQGV